jgi:glutamate synthase domain-containing protein 3
MSGGVAYVLDDEHTLAGRVSKAMVDLEPLASADEELVHSLVDEHVLHTRSARGKSILQSWAKRRFLKVMPHEWRRVLQLRKTGS